MLLHSFTNTNKICSAVEYNSLLTIHVQSSTLFKRFHLTISRVYAFARHFEKKRKILLDTCKDSPVQSSMYVIHSNTYSALQRYNEVVNAAGSEVTRALGSLADRHKILAGH